MANGVMSFGCFNCHKTFKVGLNLRRNTFFWFFHIKLKYSEFYFKPLKTYATDWKGLLTTADPIKEIKKKLLFIFKVFSVLVLGHSAYGFVVYQMIIYAKATPTPRRKSCIRYSHTIPRRTSYIRYSHPTTRRTRYIRYNHPTPRRTSYISYSHPIPS